jgi:hypothetical protein
MVTAHQEHCCGNLLVLLSLLIAACQTSSKLVAKGSVESTHKVPTSHYHTKHRTDGRCHRGRAARRSLGGLTHRRGFSRIRPPPPVPATLHLSAPMPVVRKLVAKRSVEPTLIIPSPIVCFTSSFTVPLRNLCPFAGMAHAAHSSRLTAHDSRFSAPGPISLWRYGMRLELNVKIAVIRRNTCTQKWEKNAFAQYDRRMTYLTLMGAVRACACRMRTCSFYRHHTPQSVSFGTRQGNAPGSTPPTADKAEPRKIGTRHLEASKLLASCLRRQWKLWAFLRSRYKNRSHGRKLARPTPRDVEIQARHSDEHEGLVLSAW